MASRGVLRRNLYSFQQSRCFASKKTKAWRWGNTAGGPMGSKCPELSETPQEITNPNGGEFQKGAIF